MLCFTLYLRSIFQVQAPGGLYLEGRFNGGFFALPPWGAYIWRGLFSKFYGILYVKQCKEVIDVREDAAQTKDNTLNTNTPVPTTLWLGAQKLPVSGKGSPGMKLLETVNRETIFWLCLKNSVSYNNIFEDKIANHHS